MLVAHNPRVISSHFYLLGKIIKDIVVRNYVCRCLNSVINFRKIDKFTAEYFANRLLSETNAEYRLMVGIMSNDFCEKSCFGRNARSW